MNQKFQYYSWVYIYSIYLSLNNDYMASSIIWHNSPFQLIEFYVWVGGCFAIQIMVHTYINNLRSRGRYMGKLYMGIYLTLLYTQG